MALVLLKSTAMTDEPKKNSFRVKHWPASQEQLDRTREELVSRVESVRFDLARFEKKVEARFTGVEDRMVGLEHRMGALEQRMDAFEQRVDERFDSFEKRMDERFDRFEKRFDAKLDSLFNAIAKGFKEVEAESKRTLAISEEQNFRNKQAIERLALFDERQNRLEADVGKIKEHLGLK